MHGRLALVGSLVCLMHLSYSSPLTGARWFLANYQILRGAAAGACAMDGASLGAIGGIPLYWGFSPNIYPGVLPIAFRNIPIMPLEESKCLRESAPKGRERTMEKAHMSLVFIPLQSIGYFLYSSLGISLYSPLDYSLSSTIGGFPLYLLVCFRTA